MEKISPEKTGGMPSKRYWFAGLGLFLVILLIVLLTPLGRYMGAELFRFGADLASDMSPLVMHGKQGGYTCFDNGSVFCEGRGYEKMFTLGYMSKRPVRDVTDALYSCANNDYTKFLYVVGKSSVKEKCREAGYKRTYLLGYVFRTDEAEGATPLYLRLVNEGDNPNSYLETMAVEYPTQERLGYLTNSGALMDLIRRLCEQPGVDKDRLCWSGILPSPSVSPGPSVGPKVSPMPSGVPVGMFDGVRPVLFSIKQASKRQSETTMEMVVRNNGKWEVAGTQTKLWEGSADPSVVKTEVDASGRLHALYPVKAEKKEPGGLYYTLLANGTGEVLEKALITKDAYDTYSMDVYNNGKPHIVYGRGANFYYVYKDLWNDDWKRGDSVGSGRNPRISVADDLEAYVAVEADGGGINMYPIRQGYIDENMKAIIGDVGNSTLIDFMVRKDGGVGRPTYSLLLNVRDGNRNKLVYMARDVVYSNDEWINSTVFEEDMFNNNVISADLSHDGGSGIHIVYTDSKNLSDLSDDSLVYAWIGSGGWQNETVCSGGCFIDRNFGDQVSGLGWDNPRVFYIVHSVNGGMGQKLGTSGPVISARDRDGKWYTEKLKDYEDGITWHSPRVYNVYN